MKKRKWKYAGTIMVGGKPVKIMSTKLTVSKRDAREMAKWKYYELPLAKPFNVGMSAFLE